MSPSFHPRFITANWPVASIVSSAEKTRMSPRSSTRSVWNAWSTPLASGFTTRLELNARSPVNGAMPVPGTIDAFLTITVNSFSSLMGSDS